MTGLVRIYDARERRYYLVGNGTVYADGDGDAGIRKQQQAAAGPHPVAELLRASEFFGRHFVVPCPGLRTADDRFVCYGRLNALEEAHFEAGEAVCGRRTALEEHLGFFDHDPADGVIAPRENFKAWRALGFGVLGAALKTVLSSVLFGRLAEGLAIDIKRIGATRAGRSTRVYDAKGHIDQKRLAVLLYEFDRAAARAGTAAISQEEAIQIIGRYANLGLVSAGQFRSLFAVCARLNHGKTITRVQLQALFDGSLLMLVASTPGRDGHTRLDTLTPGDLPPRGAPDLGSATTR